MTTILIASVGGSRQPVASALAACRPDFVLFLASAPEGDSAGSVGEIPAILERAQRGAQPHEILAVPPDEPESIFLALRERLRRLRAEHPRAQFVFDYTGGTKSMTGALFQAAIAASGANLQFMLGRRENLEKITPGTERATRISVDWIVAERAETRLRAAWKSFDYAAAAKGFEGINDDLGGDERAPPELRQRLRDLAEASRAFALWDRFQHAEAGEILHRLAHRHPDLVTFASRATACGKNEAARIADLWRNAERCAARGRYDDALARGYRLLEWIAQWRLWEKHGIDTSAMDWSKLSQQEISQAGLQDQRSRRTLSGLTQAWKLLAAKEPSGLVAKFLTDPFPGKDRKKDGEGRLRDMLDLRNRSILAHGEQALRLEDWQRWQTFAEHLLKNLLLPLLREAGGVAELPVQFPVDPATVGL